MFNVEKIRSDFPILARTVHGKPLVYLDNAATAQKPAAVIDRTAGLMRELNANIHRGVHFMAEESTVLYEAARETVRHFINARSTCEVVFTSGATAGINAVAYSFAEHCIRKGDNVVVSEMEHHSNIVPWQLLCERRGAALRVLPFNDEGELETEKLGELIDAHTRIVAVTQMSNVLGTRPDLSQIIRDAHAAGVPVLVDGCQGIVHGGMDVQALDADFYLFSGHKLYGPTGIGVLYGKEEWLEKLPPFMGGGEMVKTVAFTGTTYADLPLKFEAGTANYIGAIGLSEAISYLQGLDVAVIGHEENLLRHAVERLRNLSGVRIYGSSPAKGPIVSFTAEGAHHYDIGMILDKLGVAVRTGTHCAEPVMKHYGVEGMCRASFALYNTLQEVDIFIDGVEKALTMLRK